MDQIIENAKIQILNNPAEIHQISSQLIAQLSNQELNQTIVATLIRELIDTDYIQHKLLFFYCVEQILINNCISPEKNKLAILLNIVFEQELTNSYQNNGCILKSIIMIQIHLQIIKKCKQFIPELFKFLNFVIVEILKENKYFIYQKFRSQQLINKVIREDSEVKSIFLQKVLKILKEILADGNQSYHKTQIISKTILQNLKSLSHKIISQDIQILIKLIQKQSSYNQQMISEERLEFRELTPKIIDRRKKQTIKDLKVKRNKLKKRLINDLRSNIQNKIQEQRIRQQTRNERIQKRHKKELFIIQKQTAQAKKINKKIKKVKLMKKNKQKSKK